MEKLELIFIPVPGAGHLISILEFAFRLLDQDDRVSVTVLDLTNALPLAAFLDPQVKSMAASRPRLRLLDLPKVELPPLPELIKSPENFIIFFVESQTPHVRRAVKEIVSSCSDSGSRVAGLVLDFFCTSMIDVAREFNLPSYTYVPSNAGFLGLMLELPIRDDQVQREFQISDPEWRLPCLPHPLPVGVLPSAVFDKEHGGYAAYMKMARRFSDTDGIIVNTFAELETFAVNSFSHRRMPPVYTVGPVLHLKAFLHPAMDRHRWEEIWRWLDDQPPSSVLFLCFGSLGAFGESQVKEIAVGLERSGQRFLWSLRMTPKEDGDPDSGNVEKILPEGFLERTQGRGIVCGWSPQVEVLAHEATGGFVSHCGWNSILESLWNGVPIMTWPMYAEQQLNAFMMVRELGLAVEMRLDYRKGAEDVAAEEIEQAIRCLMDSESEVRKRVKLMSNLARKAVTEGGSSSDSIGRLIKDIISN